MLKLAENECTKCGNKWKDFPGPHTTCQKCGSAYVKWLNYEEEFKPKRGK